MSSSAHWAQTAVLTVFLALATLILSACSKPEEVPELFLYEPSWLASTDAPTVTNAEEVLELWGSEKRCCENENKIYQNAKVFYKACYMAIANDSRNEELVALCLKLMSHNMPREVVRTIHDHYLENYFYHDARTVRSTNCSTGDDIARVSQDYARNIGSAGNYKGALATIHRVLDERGDEITPFIKSDLYSNIAWYHEKSSFTTSDLRALETAYSELAPPPGSYGGTLHNYERLGEAIERLKKLEPSDR